MMALKWLRQPTLQRRMLLALMLVFVLVWVALLLYNVYSIVNTGEREKNLKRYAKLITAQMEHLGDARRAAEFAADVEGMQNAAYVSGNMPMKLVLSVWDKQDNPLYASDQADPPVLHGVANRVIWTTTGERKFAVFRVEAKRWNLVVALAYANTEWETVFVAKNLLPNVIIADVLALPVLWLALSRGLRPLRALSNHIAARHPDDLSGTGAPTLYGELKPLQFALDNLLDKLRSKLAREAAFVQEAAHELRTPMALISAQAHVLVLEQDATARLQAEQRLDRALARASHLVGQLLQLAQMDGTRGVQVVDMDLAQEVRTELAMLVPAARQRHIELSMEAPDTLPARLERETFASILHNLVGNAIRYVDAHNKIVISLAQHDLHLVLSVADNGPGIPPNQQAHVFERFHRGVEHSAPGAGLGLAIVKQACVRLGGSVHLKPGLDGRGCTFVVKLPVGAMDCH